eukprot:Nk52_evm108s914 gene=Nk52_evmTU108s914
MSTTNELEMTEFGGGYEYSAPWPETENQLQQGKESYSAFPFHDLYFAFFQKKKPPLYRNVHPRMPVDIIAHVLERPRVKAVVSLLAREENIQESIVWQRAQKILGDMGHSQQLGAIRCVGYTLKKVFDKLYDAVHVNSEGIERLRKEMQSTPVLLLPTHRSYVDFLLVSYLFFAYDLKLPIIAAGEDFKAMYFVSWFLRSSGAFFIRRQFGNDSLYWVLFGEYLHTQVTNGDYPVEFFIEGTRSRTGKSLHPKVGMLKTVLEPFFDHSVSDLSIFPISITYQKRLEYKLYSKELSGVNGKPKESTRGLLKARTVMQHNFGAINVYISPSISLKQYSAFCGWDRKANLSAPPCVGRGILSSQKHKIAVKLGYDVIKAQQMGLVVFLNIIVASVLLQHNISGITFVNLLALVREIVLLIKGHGGKTVLYSQHGSNFMPIQKVKEHEQQKLDLYLRVAILQSLDVIKDLVVVPAELEPFLRKCRSKDITPSSIGNVNVNDAEWNHILLPSLDGLRISLDSDIEKRIALAHMRNQVLHLFYRESLLIISLRTLIVDKKLKHGTIIPNTKELRNKFLLLQSILKFDVVNAIDEKEKLVDFERCLNKLCKSKVLAFDGRERNLKIINESMCSFLAFMVEPFVRSYSYACMSVLTLASDTSDILSAGDVDCKEALRNFGEPSLWSTQEILNENEYEQKQCISRAQALALYLFEENGARFFGDSLSSDTIKNGLQMLVEMKLLSSFNYRGDGGSSRSRGTYYSLVSDYYFAFFCSQDDSFEVTPEAIDSEIQLVDSLGLFCFPDSEENHIDKKGVVSFSFVLTDAYGIRRYVCCRAVRRVEDSCLRTIVIVSHWPYFETFRHILSRLNYEGKDSSSLNQVNLNAITYLLNEVIVPPCGSCVIRFNFLANEYYVRRPFRKALVDFPLGCLFYHLGIGNIVSIFGSLLREKQVIFHSRNVTILTYIIEGCFSLLFPLRWETVYIPVLPPSLINCIEAPTAYVIGANTDHVLEHIDTLDDSVCIVDIDEDVVRFPASVGHIYHRRLVKRLKQILSPYRGGNRSSKALKATSSNPDCEIPMKRFFTDRHCFYFKSDSERALRSVFSSFLCPILTAFSDATLLDEETIGKMIRDFPKLDDEFIEQMGSSRMLCYLLDSWTKEDFVKCKNHVDREKNIATNLFSLSTEDLCEEDLHISSSGSESEENKTSEEDHDGEDVKRDLPFVVDLRTFDGSGDEGSSEAYRRDSEGFVGSKTGLLKFQFWQPFERVVELITKRMGSEQENGLNFIQLLWMRAVCLYHMGFYLPCLKDFVAILLQQNKKCIHRLVSLDYLKEILKLMSESDRTTLPKPLLMYISGQTTYDELCIELDISWAYKKSLNPVDAVETAPVRRSVFSRRTSHAPTLLTGQARQFQGNLARRQSILEDSEGTSFLTSHLNEQSISEEPSYSPTRRNKIVLNVLDKNPAKRKSVVNALDLSEVKDEDTGMPGLSDVSSAKYVQILLETAIGIFRGVCPTLQSDKIGFVFRDAVRLNTASRSSSFKQFVLASSKLVNIDTSPSAFKSNDEKFCFFLNVRNTLLLHALLEFGPPRSKLQNLILHGITCYNVSGENVSLVELDNNILRAGLPQSLSPLNLGATGELSVESRHITPLQSRRPSHTTHTPAVENASEEQYNNLEEREKRGTGQETAIDQRMLPSISLTEADIERHLDPEHSAHSLLDSSNVAFVSFTLFNSTFSSPNLQVYCEGTLKDQLLYAAWSFVQEQVNINREVNKVGLPAHFRWFVRDFDGKSKKCAVDWVVAKLPTTNLARYINECADYNVAEPSVNFRRPSWNFRLRFVSIKDKEMEEAQKHAADEKRDIIVYQVTITTREKSVRVRRPHVSIQLVGDRDMVSPVIILADSSRENVFQPGTRDVFRLRTYDMGKVKQVIIKLGPHPSCGYLFEHVIVEDKEHGDISYFVRDEFMSVGNSDYNFISVKPYVVTVVTGEQAGSGSKNAIWIELIGTLGRSVPRKLTPHNGKFVRGNRQAFMLYAYKELGPIAKVVVEMETMNNWQKNAWFLEGLIIESKITGVRNVVICRKWLSSSEEGGRTRREFLVQQ